MLQTLSAGKQLDILTAKEVGNELRSLMQEWKVDTARGARPVNISADFTADATGLAVGGGSQLLSGGTLGPNQGFWWAVVRLAVRVDSAPAPFELYKDRRSAQSLVRDVNGDQNGYASFGAQELLVEGGASLVVAVGSQAPGSRAYVSGQAIEIPNQLLYKWLAG